MNKIFKLMTAVMMVLTAVTFSACKKSFDNPPGAGDPDIVANTSIKALKAMHTSSGAYDVITSDLIISGVVCSICVSRARFTVESGVCFCCTDITGQSTKHRCQWYLR